MTNVIDWMGSQGLFVPDWQRASLKEVLYDSALTVGVFAKTPDPIVFGPDRFISPNPYMLDAFSSWRRPFLYLAPYDRSDYPDYPWHVS